MAASRRFVAMGSRICSGVLCAAPMALTGPHAAVHAQPAAAEGVEEIVVTSSLVAQPRRQIGTAVAIIDSTEIELRGYPGLADVLRTQTGVGVSNSGGPGKNTALRIRGEEAFRTLLLIDGVKAVDPSAPQPAPSFDSLLATSDLQRVEVLRGPQGFIYGADAGGVVNVITKRGADELGGALGLEYGADALRKLDGALSGGGERGDYFVSVTDFATDGFNAQTADAALRDDDGADNSTLHAKLGWNVSDDVRLQLVARDVDAATAEDGCFSVMAGGTIHDCRSTLEQTTYKVSADITSGSLTSSLGLSSVDIARDSFAAGASAFATEGELARFEYTGSYAANDALALVFGVDLQEEQLVADDGVRSRDQTAYYVEYQGAFADALFVTIGARYDDNDDFGSHTSARVSGAYVQQLGGDRSVKYRASIGTGFRAPSLFELAYNAGPFAFPPAAAVALEEEVSAGFDVGVEYDAGTGLRLEVTLFDQRIEDEIFFDLVGFSGYLQSSGKSTSKGVEIAAVVPAGERWQVHANLTRNDADTAAGEPRLRRPELLGNLGLMYRPAAGRISVLANYRLARDSIDIGSVPLDDYEVLDVAAQFALDERIELHARLENATDEKYEEVRGYRTSGRSAHAGVRWRF
jgi:vitamin B12 transporter